MLVQCGEVCVAERDNCMGMCEGKEAGFEQTLCTGLCNTDFSACNNLCQEDQDGQWVTQCQLPQAMCEAACCT